jgi:hypothetical protein
LRQRASLQRRISIGRQKRAFVDPNDVESVLKVLIDAHCGAIGGCQACRARAGEFMLTQIKKIVREDSCAIRFLLPRAWP